MNLDGDSPLPHVLRGEYPIQPSLGRARRNHPGLEHLPLRVLRSWCQVDKCSENRGQTGRYALNRVFHDDMKRHALF